MFDQVNKFKHLLPWLGGKKSLGILVLRKRRRLICQRSNAMVVRNMGITREFVLNSRRKTRKGKKGMKPMSPKKWKKLRRRNKRSRK